MDQPTTAIIQARMGSTRLPGKVLLDIAGEPMLVRVVERASKASVIKQVVVATTCEPADDPVAGLCKERGYNCYRGSMFDVLDRYYQAALLYNAGVIIRVTADCPLIDPDVIDRTVRAFHGDRTPFDCLLTVNGPTDPQINTGCNNHYSKPIDFAANRLPPPWGRTYPIGLDTEVCTIDGLGIAWNQAIEAHQREHVMPYFYDHLDRFRVLLVNNDQDYGSLRWTVDTAEDLELVRQIFTHFKGRDDFSWLETLELYRQSPELAKINAGVAAKHYRQVDKRP